MIHSRLESIISLLLVALLASLSALLTHIPVTDISAFTQMSISNLQGIVSHWGLTSSDAGFDPVFDLNHDKLINYKDVLIGIDDWQAARNAASPTPGEPDSNPRKSTATPTNTAQATNTPIATP